MPVSTLISDYRTAGVFLLLTALATAISVPARLMADADATPFTDALPRSMNLDAAEIARLEASERLHVIGSANVAYGIGGAARLAGGLTLVAAGIFLWRTMRPIYPAAMAIVALLLVASGIASAISGAAALALAGLAPEPQMVEVVTSGESGWARMAQPGEPHTTAVQLPDVGFVEDALFSLRWATGTIGFTLAGLGLAALAPVQWRVGGVLRATAIVEAVLGLAMLFIWVDAATVVHRITGIAFLIWLIVAGLWLVAGREKPVAASLPR